MQLASDLGDLLDDLDAAVQQVHALQALFDCRNHDAMPHGFVEFHRELSTILQEHRIAYDLVNAQMIETASQEMHAGVVEPVLQLLHGRNDLRGVEVAYQKALEELHEGDPADTITDAATALQETFVAIGCKGNSLGPLVDDAKRRGF